MGERPSVSRIVGQLGYLFEERPELAGASAAELCRWLNREDRMARARAMDPLGSTEAVVAAGERLENRITEDQVAEALRRLRHIQG